MIFTSNANYLEWLADDNTLKVLISLCCCTTFLWSDQQMTKANTQLTNRKRSEIVDKTSDSEFEGTNLISILLGTYGVYYHLFLFSSKLSHILRRVVWETFTASGDRVFNWRLCCSHESLTTKRPQNEAVSPTLSKLIIFLRVTVCVYLHVCSS